MSQASEARGINAVGVFLFFGCAMATLAGTTLTWPGTALDRIWELNARAYRQLAPLGELAGIGFLVLGAVLLASAVGWLRRRVWGWRLAVAIIAAQVLGDLVNAIRGEVLGGVVGCTIAGALLIYLLQPRVRAAFDTGSVKGSQS